MGAREALRPPLTLPTGRVPVPGTRSASNAAHLMLRLRNSGGRSRFRRAQNTAPSARLPAFLRKGGTPPPVFAGGWFARCKTVAGMAGCYAHVEIFNRAWQACETFLADCSEFTCVGHAWRAAGSSGPTRRYPRKPQPVVRGVGEEQSASSFLSRSRMVSFGSV